MQRECSSASFSHRSQIILASSDPSAQVGGLGTNVNKLTTTQIHGLSATQLTGLNSTQLGGTTTTFIAALTTTQLGQLTGAQVNGLGTTLNTRFGAINTSLK